MTAPFAPSLQLIHWAVIVGLVAVAFAMPFARRDDWLGWCAFLVITAVAALIALMLLAGLWRHARKGRSRRSAEAEELGGR